MSWSWKKGIDLSFGLLMLRVPFTPTAISHTSGRQEHQCVMTKSLVAAIMVSDFINEKNGFVRNDTEETHVYLDRILQQVEHTIDIFVQVHPEAQGLFCLKPTTPQKSARWCLKRGQNECSSRWNATSNARTIWDGKVLAMVYPDGFLKGTKAVLEEKGIDTKHMKAANMKKIGVIRRLDECKNT